MIAPSPLAGFLPICLTLGSTRLLALRCSKTSKKFLETSGFPIALTVLAAFASLSLSVIFNATHTLSKNSVSVKAEYLTVSVGKSINNNIAGKFVNDSE
ncbi:hypothetical protein BDQ17DRAFT_1366470 [Cyathus striatus]|nr:hypothetical protein BDQ17DRAFT_1366470 [Cyathus striatus]